MSDEKRTIFGYAPAPGQQPGSQPSGNQPQAPPQQPAPQAQPPQPMGQPPMGQPPMGQPPMGQPPMGQPPLGQPPMGQPQMGQPPMGQPGMQPPMGQPQMGQPQMGQPGMQQPMGQPPMGQPPMGQPMGQPPMGQPPMQPMGPGMGPGMPMHPGMAPPRPRVKPVSTGLYVGAIVLGFLLGGVLFAWGATDRKVAELLMFAWIPLLVGGIFYLVLLYKAWAAINDGYSRTTPGKAVGFMFIPLFSLYWMFVAIYGWSQDYNAFCQRHRIPAQPASTGLFLFHCIASLIIGIVTPITMIIICLQMCRGINSIAQGGVPQAVARY